MVLKLTTLVSFTKTVLKIKLPNATITLQKIKSTVGQRIRIRILKNIFIWLLSSADLPQEANWWLFYAQCNFWNNLGTNLRPQDDNTLTITTELQQPRGTEQTTGFKRYNVLNMLQTILHVFQTKKNWLLLKWRR